MSPFGIDSTSECTRPEERTTTGGRRLATRRARIDPFPEAQTNHLLNRHLLSNPHNVAEARYTISKTRPSVECSDRAQALLRRQEVERGIRQDEREVLTGKQCGRINSETSERERGKDRGEIDKKPKRKRKKTNRPKAVLLHEKERRKKKAKAQTTIPLL